MFKRLLFSLFLLILISFSGMGVFANEELEISNEYISFTMPQKTKGTYIVDMFENGIYVCEKISVKKEQGGFAFGIKIYKNSNEYADMEDTRKIGELVAPNGTTYDVTLIHPREIYYGNGRRIARNYKRLYDFAPTVEIKGINGYKFTKCD